MPSPVLGDFYLTQGYGLTSFAQSRVGREVYRNFPGGIHPGLDFGTHGINQPAVSTCPGVVVAAGPKGGWGNMVEVKGGDGWRRMYAHLQTASVRVGQTVMVGTTLGRIGSTGASTGVHLHYGHRKWKPIVGWKYRDPSPELIDVMEEAMKTLPLPTGRLLKSDTGPEIYAWTGRMKHHIPDMETLEFIFQQEKMEIVDQAVLSKLPVGVSFVSVK